MLRSEPFSEHAAAPLTPESGGKLGQKVAVQAKLEYHSQKASQGELITDGELIRWWLASKLSHGVPVWVGPPSPLKVTAFMLTPFHLATLNLWSGFDTCVP